MKITSLSENSVIPANLKYPIIEWDDEVSNVNYILKIQSSNRSLSIKVRGNKYHFKSKDFIQFLKEKEITVSVSRTDNSASDKVSIKVDESRFNDVVIYRLVEPLFNPSQDALIEIYSMENPCPLSWLKLKSSCVGCHSYGKNSAILNVKRNKDRRFVYASMENSIFKQQRFGEFSFVEISPDGSKILLVLRNKSIIETKSNIYEPFDMTYTAGDIGVYDIDTGKLNLLRGASKPDVIEDTPVWSPDGETIVFTRYKPYSKTNRLNPVSIWQIPYNDGKGGKAKPFFKKSPAKYCYFPKFSPDGRFLSFVASDAQKGYFARTSSTIWLYNIEKKIFKEMDLNQKGVMNSWHSWSKDGKWLLFSSKRGKNGLTGLFIARVFEDGSSAPAVKIVSPDNYKVNLPVVVPSIKDIKSGKNIQDFIDFIYK
ncbi:MAG: hypothetical protein N2258_04955 [Brevinematales bacterium]|nr:hypothetical protein [Brevinematales bacterium]